MSCESKGTPGNILSKRVTLWGSTLCVFKSNLQKSRQALSPSRPHGLRVSGARAPPTGRRGCSHLHTRPLLKSRAFPLLRGRSPEIWVTSEPKPNLSRRLGPSTDWPVYTHTWRPTKEKGHFGLGTQHWSTVSLNARREKPGRPSLKCHSRVTAAKIQ